MELMPLTFLWRYACGLCLWVRCFYMAFLGTIGKGIVGWL